jgi:HEAT repeat protein
MTARYFLAVACLALPAFASAGEPFAQGRPLSYWLLLREGELRVDPAGPWESELGPGPFRASLALKTLGPEARGAVPALLAWFREGNESADAHRIKARYLATALRDVGCTDPSLAPLLRGLAALGDDRLTAMAMQTLDMIDAESTADVRRHQKLVQVALLLAEYQASAQQTQRFDALAKLARIDPEQARVGIPFLSELLLDPITGGSSRRDDVLDPTPILQQMGAAARDAAPLLEYRAHQERRASFAIALAHIAPDQAAKMLRKEPADFRKEVVRLLSNKDSLQPALVSLFAGLLDDRSVSLDAAAGLLKVDPIKAKMTMPIFVEALNDFDPGTQLRAAAALPRLDPSRNKEVAGVLRSIIKNYEGATRDRALDLLAPTGKEAIPAMLDLLDDPRWWHAVLDGLPRFGSDAKVAVPALQKMLVHKDRSHRIRAAWALAWIDPASLKSAVPALLEAVEDASAFTRETALLTLGQVAGDDPRSLATLTGKLGSKSSLGEVTAAVHALLRVGKEAVKPLIARLSDDNLQARCNAAWVLGEIGPPAREALPALRKLLGDRELLARVRAVYALARIDPKQDLEEVERVLHAGMERGDRTGQEAALALGRLARERNLMPAIVHALEVRPTSAGSANAALALAVMGPKAVEHLPLLLPVLRWALTPFALTAKDQIPLRVQEARLELLLRACGGLGPEARKLIPSILPLWKIEGLRPFVDGALEALISPNAQGLPELKALLDDRALRSRVVALFPKLGSTVRVILPGLSAPDEFDALDEVLGPAEAVVARVRRGVWPPASYFEAGSLGEPRLRDVEIVRRAGKRLIPALVDLLSDRSEKVRVAAAYALGLAGPAAAKEAVPRLTAMLKEARAYAGMVIAAALWRMCPDGNVDADLIFPLRKLLKEQVGVNSNVRVWAAQRLGEMGNVAKVAIPDLVEIAWETGRSPLRTRLAAVEALGVLRASDKQTLRALSGLVERHGKEPELILAAVVALGRIGPAAKDVFPSVDSIRKRLDLKWDEDLGPRMKLIVIAEARVNPGKTPAMVKVLVDRVKEGYPGAADILVAIDPTARSAVPDLVETYRKSQNPVLRKELLAALRVLGPVDRETVPGIARNVRKVPDDALILAAFGTQSKGAVPELMEGLQAHAKGYQPGTAHARQVWKGANYVDALAAIGPDARAAVPELLKLHEQWRKEPLIYLRVAAALKKIDPDAARKAGIP